MAKGVNFGGGIDYNYWLNMLNNAKDEAAAREVVRGIMNATTAGFFNVGVSDKDQQHVANLIKAYGEKYNADVSQTLKYWDPNQNHINSTEVKRFTEQGMDLLGYGKAADNSGLSNEEVQKLLADLNGSNYGSGGGTRGYYSSSTPSNNYAQLATPTKVNWQEKSIDEMAELLGLENYKTADILKLYNDATNKKFDELDTQIKRGQAENLRTLEGQYDTYLNNVRNDRANAIANGMTKGASAAMQLATMYANAQAVSDNQQTYYDTLYDVAQQRGTALEENAITAYKDRQAIEQYLGNARANYEANSVNELAAKLGASAEVEAARLQADATTKAAGLNLQAALNQGAGLQDQILQKYIIANKGNMYQGYLDYIKQLQRDSVSNENYVNYQIANNK